MARGKYEFWLADEGLTLLEGWAREGLTDEQIAHNMGISTKTLYDWKNKYGKICESLKSVFKHLKFYNGFTTYGIKSI